ncbi:MAG: acyl-CoA thioesterase [Deltaproteobacteria bacterium]|jgi:acyl-CoA thioester hydrolase|nr:acyl-CoA thioesterase [Syntrophaceae bacterium]
MSAGKKSFEVRISVPFFDLDPMQIVWHGNYLNYFEIARAALFEHHGVDLYSYYEREKIIFPIIRTATKHIFPLKHRDEIIVKATLVDAHIKLVVDFEIRRVDDDSVCARGRTEQVAVKTPEMETLFSLPEDIRRLLDA